MSADMGAGGVGVAGGGSKWEFLPWIAGPCAVSLGLHFALVALGLPGDGHLALLMALSFVALAVFIALLVAVPALNVSNEEPGGEHVGVSGNGADLDGDGIVTDDELALFADMMKGGVGANEGVGNISPDKKDSQSPG